MGIFVAATLLVFQFPGCLRSTGPNLPANPAIEQTEEVQQVETRKGKKWEVACVEDAPLARKECRIFLLNDHSLGVSLFQGKGYPFLQAVSFPDIEEKQLLMQVDKNKPLTWKIEGNSSGMYEKLIAEMKAGHTMTLLKPGTVGNKKIKEIPLQGFTAAYKYAREKLGQ